MVSAVLSVLVTLVLSARAQDAVVFPLGAGSVRLAAIGDMGTGEAPQFDVARQMVRARASFPFEFVITLGDNIYTGKKPSDFEKAFAAPYRALLDAGVALETQLHAAGSGADWKVCYFHHPLYSSGKRHGSDERLRKLLEPLFIRYGVDVVFSGHDHVYERILPQHGITYFVDGASGKLRAGNLTPSGLTAQGFDADCSFLLVEFAGDAMHFRAVSRGGATVDNGVVHRTMRSGLQEPANPR